MRQRQVTTPLFLKGGRASQLQRIPLSSQFKSESWLQKLLFEHPLLLPVEEIEPVFSGLLPVARELPTGAGPLDLIYVNSRGHLTLVETKLWRNPEARRSVVAQIIDYAKDISAWTYNDLLAAIQRVAPTSGSDPLVDLARQSDEDFDESTFVDTVARNLRLGRFLLLIVGDGIQEGAEGMADFLQRTPQLGFTLGLVELALFRVDANDDDSIFVQPRVLARTREVVRAVVEVKNMVAGAQVSVTLPAEDEQRSGARRNITEDEFFERLARHVTPDVVSFARSAVDEAPRHEIEVDWKAAGPLFKYVDPDTGEFFTLGGFTSEGEFGHAGWIDHRFRTLELPTDVSNKFLDEIVGLFPGAKRWTGTKQSKKWGEITLQDVEADKKLGLPLSVLSKHRAEWFAAMDRIINEIKTLMRGRS